MPVREFKALSWFKTKRQVRAEESAVQELRASFLEHGQLQDVAALEDGTLIFGHRRLAAAILAKLEGLWAQLYPQSTTPAEIRVIQLVENCQRVDLTLIDQASAVKAMAEEGMELKEIAKRVGKPPNWATRLGYVWKVIPAAREALQAGAIGISDIEALAKLDPAEQHEVLPKRIAREVTRDDLARHARKRNTQPRKPTKRAQLSRLRLSVPCGVTIALAALELPIDRAIEALGEGIAALRQRLAGDVNT